MYRLFLLIAVTLFLPNLIAAQGREPIALGEPFPEIPLSTPAGSDEQDYLGIGEETFTLSQIDAQVVLVELLNVHCPHCRMQVPAYNQLDALLAENPKIGGKIKMLGIAVGNTEEEVAAFVERLHVAYPVVADPKFTAIKATGATATPYTLYVRQTEPGQPGVVAGTHLGLNTRYREIFAQLQEITRQSPEQLRREGTQAAEVRNAITPLFSPEKLQYRVRTVILETGDRIEDFSSVELRSGRRVYTARMQRETTLERVFAEVVSRTSVCDICHDVHFIYIFDGDGRVLNFAPLQLTKYGNVEWSEEEIAKMRRQLVGRYLGAPLSFDPKVDAITSATMTSAIIYDSIDQGDALLEELRKKGLI